MSLPIITELSCEVLNVSSRTNWTFVRVQTNDGNTSWGEASLNGWETMQQAAVMMLRDRLVGKPIDEAMEALSVSPYASGGLVYASVVSGLAQAYLAWRARHLKHAWSAELGSLQRPRVRAYANINRTTSIRTPEGFAASAKKALAEGFTAFKAAPFENLTPALCGTFEGKQRLHHGINCMLALRDAIGTDARLMVDCHWRFDEQATLKLLHELAPAQLHWLECPLPEVPQSVAALQRIKRVANEQGVLTAGAENLIGVQGFQSVLDSRTYDVIMPDVKYCGGPWAMLKIAQRASEAGVLFSPHNPTGPLASLHSLNVAGVVPECDMIELQYDESPLFNALLSEHPSLNAGAFDVPQASDFSATMNTALLQQHPYKAVGFGVEALAMGMADPLR
jgi:galactonate dehydratase